ncbi:uncharacterized protein LOC133815267 [Humulus lupulus]|uniref:uncharacterized protein LOC133815267 n=1 Tax=Humulus lupulus TaxID=3486 RepID=UPI002B4017FC|nr:uncharacterized protein LOC133815267 [Humulus lupulus]
MSFGLTNAPATFCTLMNQVFHMYLDKFVVVYLDDIVVYSAMMEEHQEYLAQESIKFLGHVMECGRIRMDLEKVWRHYLQGLKFVVKTDNAVLLMDNSHYCSQTVDEYRGWNLRAFHFTKDWKKTTEIAQAYLENASKRMKKWADQKCKPLEFKAGDLVLIKLRPEHLRF